MIRGWLRRQAMEKGRLVGPYRRFGHPDGIAWADYLRAHGGLYHLGEGCSILPSARIIDPELTSIAEGVQLGSCTLICHDGSIEVIGRRHGLKLDRVGALVIERDVFVGEGALIMATGGKVTIGEGAVIGAGAVIRQSVKPGTIMTGNPAKSVGNVEDMLRFWEADTIASPWGDIIAKREGAFDPALQPELTRRRQRYFFGRAKEDR